MKALMFSGQGSQYVGMTSDLTEGFDVARNLAAQASEVLGFDIHHIMVNGPLDVLTETRNTQPALFLHEAMILAITQINKAVDAAAGHSLGEFSALYAAGVLDFADALKLVRTRGDIMFETGKRIPGTMAAVLGLDNDRVDSICRDLTAEGNGVIVPANYNSIGQVVVSGDQDLVRKSLDVFKASGARLAKELQVSGAFHSPLLTSAMEQWTEAVTSVPFNDAAFPIYTNTTGRPETKADALRQAAIEQMTSPVLWTQTLQAMQTNGITTFTEVGPQNVLQGLAKRTLEGITIFGLDKAEDCARYLGILGDENGNT